MKIYLTLLGLILWSIQGMALSAALHPETNERGESSHTSPSASLQEELLNSFDHVLEEARSNPTVVIPELQKIRKENNRHATFGTEHDNEASFTHWVLYSRALFILSQVGDDRTKESAKRRLEKQIQRKIRYLKNVEAYTVDKVDMYPQYLEGIWMQVATFDQEARKALIQEYAAKSLLGPSPDKKAYWTHYQTPLNYT